MPTPDNRPGFLSRIFSRKETAVFPSIEQLHISVEALLQRAENEPDLKKQLQALSGGTIDADHSFGAITTTDYTPSVHIVIKGNEEGEPDRPVCTILIGEESHDLILQSRTAFPDTYVFRHRSMQNVTSGEALGKKLYRLVKDKIVLSEKISLAKRETPLTPPKSK